MLASEKASSRSGAARPSLEDGTAADEETRCDLLLALADAQNQAGEMAAAQQTALRAAESARMRGAREQLSKAALAFAPRFVFGESLEVDPAVVTLLEEALTAWGSDDSPLHAKLLARLATALVYVTTAVPRREELSEQAVAMARRVGDREGLMYALHVRHWAMWAFGNAEERLPVDAELIHLAEAAGDDPMAFQGHYWRFWDLLELGRAAALEVELETCVRLADRQDPYHSFHVIVLRAARALMAGRESEIHVLLAELQALAQRWSSSNTYLFMGHLLWNAARQRGSSGNLLTLFEPAFASRQALPLGRCSLAMLYADAGRTDDARTTYASFVPDGLSAIPDDWNRGLSLVLLAEVCQELGDDRGAVVLYETLQPHADGCVTNAGFFGAVALYLGMLATMQRRWTEATQHFEHALGVHDRLATPPWLARTRYEYARMLVARASAGDLERAGALLVAARVVAAELSLDGLFAKVNALVARIADLTTEPPVVAAGAVDAGTANVFRREDDDWTIVYADAAVRLRDAKGLHYIAHLLAHPARDVHVADLATLGIGVDGPTVEDDLGAVLDPRATAEFRRRLADLREQVDEATASGDLGRAERARHETELITRELAAAYGLGRRARLAGDPAERARKAVTNRIRRAVELIHAAHPALGRHLTNALRTGFVCAYRPEHAVEWRV